jgi:hypothetical protein
MPPDCHALRPFRTLIGPVLLLLLVAGAGFYLWDDAASLCENAKDFPPGPGPIYVAPSGGIDYQFIMNTQRGQQMLQEQTQKVLAQPVPVPSPSPSAQPVKVPSPSR